MTGSVGVAQNISHPNLAIEYMSDYFNICILEVETNACD
jgi:hypothetical protein